MYDVIVVGARCAGSPLAMLLARKGYRVLLADKATFPSDTISGHLIWQPGVARLKKWGLLDKVIDSNCPAITKCTFDVGEFALTGHPPAVGDITEAYCPRRTVLDKILVDAAVSAGAELREGFSVQEILVNNGRVNGIRGRTKAGLESIESGRIVVGADGLHSIVARTVRPAAQYEKAPFTCWYYTYWSGVPMEGVEFYAGDDCTIGAVPTNDELSLIGLAWTHNQFHRVRADIEGNYNRTLSAFPSLADRVHKGNREERFVGIADLPSFFRKPYGPGWALIGDSGYHKDPVTAQGITDAFRDAELLSDAIDSGFSGREPLNDALTTYEQRRNEASLPIYKLTCDFAALQRPTGDMLHLFEALRPNKEDTSCFFGTMAGTFSVDQFFSLENRERILRNSKGGQCEA